jgi:hypothetical protein
MIFSDTQASIKMTKPERAKASNHKALVISGYSNFGGTLAALLLQR